MPAFVFPADPDNGDRTTNQDTGVVYEFLDPPGKWVLVAEDSNTTYVNVSGDTMTGQLNLYPTEAEPSGELNIKTATNGEDDFALKLRDSDENIFFQAGGDTAVEYFGRYEKTVDIATKGDVDSAVDAGSLIHGGTIAEGSEGSVSSTGNLSVQKSSGGSGGNLYVRSAPNTDVIALEQTGTITLYGNQQIVATGSSNPSVLLTADTTDAAAFGTSYISLKQPVTSNKGITIVDNGLTVTKGSSSFTPTVTFKDTCTFSDQNPLLFNYGGSTAIDIKDNILFYGLKSDGTRPSWEAIRLGADPNNENFSAMTIGKRMYWQGGYVYFDGSVRNYLDDNIWDFRDNDTDNNILTELDASGQTFAINCSTQLTAPPNKGAGLSLSQANNTTSLWNAVQAGHIQFLTTTQSGGGNCAISVAGQYARPSLFFLVQAPGLSTDKVMTIGVAYDSNDRPYRSILVSPYVTTPGGTAYGNVKNLPDNTAVNLGMLRNQGLIGTATTTVTQDPSSYGDGEDQYISTQSQVNIPAQLELEGRLTTGRGFTLTGCTEDQPTNTSAVCLRLMHNITSAAQLEYLGDTSGTDHCIQTKASVQALINQRSGSSTDLLSSANTWSGQNTFTNVVNLGTNSAQVDTTVRGTLSVFPSSATSLTGFNNGAVACNKSDGSFASGLSSDGLTTAYKLIFDRNVSTQDILLKGTDGKGLNIKDVNSSTEATFASFKRSGSSLSSPLSLQQYKITDLANPTSGFDAANKLYADSIGTAANDYTDTQIQALPLSNYATLTGGNTFTGGSSGEQKYSCSFTINTNQIITFNSVLYHNSILYMNQSTAQQKVRIRNHSSKTLLFTSTDANSDEQNVLELGTALTTNYTNVGFKGTVQGLSGSTGYDLIIDKISTLRLQNYITRFEPNDGGSQARIEACTGTANGEWLLMVSDSNGNAQLNTSFQHASTTCYRPWDFTQAVSFSSAHTPTCSTGIVNYNNAYQLTNKQYVDNQTTSLKSTLHTAINGASDFASLKSALLAALA